MGQAKIKGNRELRITKAVEKIEAFKPKYIVCNNCQAKLTEITSMNSRNISGIEIVFAANCTACNHDTFAIRGTPEAVADLSMAMELTTGDEVKMGIASFNKTN